MILFPEKLQGWSFSARMPDVTEIKASFTFNQRQEKEKKKLIGDEYF